MAEPIVAEQAPEERDAVRHEFDQGASVLAATGGSEREHERCVERLRRHGRDQKRLPPARRRLAVGDL